MVRDTPSPGAVRSRRRLAAAQAGIECYVEKGRGARAAGASKAKGSALLGPSMTTTNPNTTPLAQSGRDS